VCPTRQPFFPGETAATIRVSSGCDPLYPLPDHPIDGILFRRVLSGTQWMRREVGMVEDGRGLSDCRADNVRLALNYRADPQHGQLLKRNVLNTIFQDLTLIQQSQTRLLPGSAIAQNANPPGSSFNQFKHLICFRDIRSIFALCLFCAPFTHFQHSNGFNSTDHSTVILFDYVSSMERYTSIDFGICFLSSVINLLLSFLTYDSQFRLIVFAATVKLSMSLI
jgi:hypothetical protein